MTKILGKVFYCLIIIVSIFSIIELFNMFNVESAEYGEPITSATQENLEEVAKYDIGFIEFEKINENNYIATYTFSYQYFDGTKNSYNLFFNGIKLNTEQSAGTLTSTLIKTFYNTKNEVEAKVNIQINYEFTVSNTVVTFKTTSSGEDLSYFTTYMNINGATLVVAMGD